MEFNINDLKAVVITCLQKKYVDFSGRAGRAEFWYWTLFALVVTVIANAISPTLGTLVSLALLLPGLDVGVRRLHDLNQSGWLMLIVFIPVLGALGLLVWFTQKGTEGSNEYGS